MADFVLVDETNQKLIQDHPEIAVLAQALVRKANARGFKIDNDTAVDELVDAISAINEVRRFTPTDDELFEEKYHSLSIQLAISSISKYGAEGQSSHGENNVSRAYENGSPYPKSLLQGIVPLARGVD